MRKQKLALNVAGALAVKLVALMAIYFLFFASPPKIDPNAPFAPTASASQR